jgi:hypothetical protein
MIKNFALFAFLLACGAAYAKSTCADIQGQQKYPPLITSSGTICFIQEPVLDPKTNAKTGSDAISLYLIVGGNAPVKAEGRGLFYDDTPPWTFVHLWLNQIRRENFIPFPFLINLEILCGVTIVLLIGLAQITAGYPMDGK